MIVAEREFKQAETSWFPINQSQNVEKRSNKFRTIGGFVLVGLGTYFIFDGLNKGNGFKAATGVVLVGIGLYMLSKR